MFLSKAAMYMSGLLKFTTSRAQILICSLDVAYPGVDGPQRVSTLDSLQAMASARIQRRWMLR